MTLLGELRIFVKHILYWIYSLVGFSLFFLLFGFHWVSIYGKNFILPIFSENSFSVQVFHVIKNSFLPSGVQLIVTNPWSGFVAQLEIAIILAYIVTFPFFLYKIIEYISPALFEHEKKAILKSLFFSNALFLFGCVFAFFYMIPLTFKFMYPFAAALGVITFFSLDSFIAWTIAILISTGIVFLLPVFMIALVSLRIVSPDFWKRKWRVALVFLLAFCALITPDQTGFTMILLFVPLMALYWLGAILTSRRKKAAF